MFFSDVNVIHGVVKDFATDTPFGRFLTPGLSDRADVEIIIRPQHLKMDFDRDGRGPLPTPQDGVPARGRVLRARFIGNRSILELAMDHDGSPLKATIPGVFLPKPDTPLWLSLRRDRCFVFPCTRQRELDSPYFAEQPDPDAAPTAPQVTTGS
jgi:iron(III) transport system ATP-binding protein